MTWWPMLAFLQVAADAAQQARHFWEYLTLGATGIVTEEAAPLIGGLRAHDGYLHLSLVGAWITAGTWSADILLYYIGRWHGDWVRRRWPRIRTFMVRALKIVRRHPWRCSTSVRFAYGLRLTLPIACGAARIPILLYLIGSGISAITWSFAFTLVGWGFGRTTRAMLGHVRRYESYVVALILVILAIAFWFMQRRHVEDEVVEALAFHDTGPVPKISEDEA